MIPNRDFERFTHNVCSYRILSVTASSANNPFALTPKLCTAPFLRHLGVFQQHNALPLTDVMLAVSLPTIQLTVWSKLSEDPLHLIRVGKIEGNQSRFV